MRSNYILGSGLVALLCKKILGDKYQILPIGPSRFYSSGVPAWSDDFVIKHSAIDEVIKDWPLNKMPMFFKRPLSFGGQLFYENQQFISNYLTKVGIEITPVTLDYFSKTTLTVYSFSCLQLWDFLLKDSINDIKKFHNDHQFDSISKIEDHKIILKTKTGPKILEYDKIISTIPANVLGKLVGSPIEDPKYMYYYHIEDDSINIENANQVLVADEEIIFHKCTKLSRNRYVLEILDKYDDNIARIAKVIGHNFEILNTKCFSSYYPQKYNFNDKDIVAVGSIAQPDPLMDIGSCIRRIYNLANGNEI